MKQTKQSDSQELPVPISEQATNGTLSSTDAAKAELLADKQRREQAFGEAIEAASKEFKCGLVARVEIVGNQVASSVAIVAQD